MNTTKKTDFQKEVEQLQNAFHLLNQIASLFEAETGVPKSQLTVCANQIAATTRHQPELGFHGKNSPLHIPIFFFLQYAHEFNEDAEHHLHVKDRMNAIIQQDVLRPFTVHIAEVLWIKPQTLFDPLTAPESLLTHLTTEKITKWIFEEIYWSYRPWGPRITKYLSSPEFRASKKWFHLGEPGEIADDNGNTTNTMFDLYPDVNPRVAQKFFPTSKIAKQFAFASTINAHRI